MKWIVYRAGNLVGFLSSQLEGHSNKFLRRLLEANLCRVNGKVERFASRKVSKGDVIELAPSFQTLLHPKLYQFKTVFENDALKIVNKPAGFVCSPQETLKIFGPQVSLVHRLDKDTTGLLILAKKKSVHDTLLQIFKERQIQKKYLALVDGCVRQKEGTRESLLIKKGSYHGQTIWGSSPNQGLKAITHFRRLKVGKESTLMECTPVTGRTHQIRVHMAEMGHPILIDPQYARSYRSNVFCQRTLLHAYQLDFVFDGEEIHAQVEVPEDMRALLVKTATVMGSFSIAPRDVCFDSPIGDHARCNGHNQKGGCH